MIKYALMGFGVSVLCLLIPLVHFVSGPLAPLIGGWFAGNNAKAEPGQAAGIGLLMGVLMAIPAVAAPRVVDALAPFLMSWADDGMMLAIGIGLPLYTALLGTAGALIGGRMAAKS